MNNPIHDPNLCLTLKFDLETPPAALDACREPVDSSRLFYGISVQPASFLGDSGLVIVDYDHRKRLRYWGGHWAGWVDSVFEAQHWPRPAPGEVPYAENNAYSLWFGYKIGPFSVCCTHGPTLSPCGIAFRSGSHYLYLKGIVKPEQRFIFTDAAPSPVTEWTSDTGQAMRICGVNDLRIIFFSIVQNAGI